MNEKRSGILEQAASREGEVVSIDTVKCEKLIKALSPRPLECTIKD